MSHTAPGAVCDIGSRSYVSIRKLVQKHLLVFGPINMNLFSGFYLCKIPKALETYFTMRFQRIMLLDVVGAIDLL